MGFLGRGYEVGMLDYGVALFVLVGILFLSDVMIVIFFVRCGNFLLYVGQCC